VPVNGVKEPRERAIFARQPRWTRYCKARARIAEAVRRVLAYVVALLFQAELFGAGREACRASPFRHSGIGVVCSLLNSEGF